jgi:calcium-dependent protein kinase
VLTCCCCCISSQEFLTATVFLGKLQRRENLMAAFQHFDTDGSGFITEDELRQVSG